MRCRSCSSLVPDSGRFCPSCGSALEHDLLATQGATTPASPPLPSGGGAKNTTPGSGSGQNSGGFSSQGRFLPGALLAGRYRIVALLGRGGMGEVYRADDMTLGQPVALKFLPESAARDPEALARFRNEVRIARKVSHPNVCRVYDLGEAEGLTFLSMEYVDGEDLSSLLRRIGRLPGDKALEIARQLCAGLAAAHREGVLHRDLKPANVMIDGRGRAVMTDFGLAGLADQIQGLEIRSGTPAYMAPEQLEGREVTPKSDLYALGLVLYEVFTGRPAFSAASPADMLRSRQENAPSSPSNWVKDLDPAVERVILRCLQRDPAARPAGALAVAAALPGGDPLAAALAAGETPSPEMVAAAGEDTGASPRTTWITLAAVVVGLVLFVALGIRENGLVRMHPESSPEMLSQRAREIVGRLGYPETAADHAAGYEYDLDLLNHLDGLAGSSADWDGLLKVRPSLLDYWYRQSPRPLIPAGYRRSLTDPSAVGFDDPPAILSGMINLQLDPQGHLTYWQAIPPQVDSSAAPSAPADWSALFASAGLDPAKLQPAEPTWVSLAACDTRAAWTGTWPGGTQPLRVEAAAWHGKPVYFSLLGPWSRPVRMQAAPLSSAQKVSEGISAALFVILLVFAVFLARKHRRQGRSDLQGALRLGFGVFVMDLLFWICMSHPAPAMETLAGVALAAGSALFVAAATWGLYLALEPYVRRHWPQTIISWSRLMAGRPRDPLVGREVLGGVALGIAWALIFQAGYLFQMHRGAQPMFGATEYLLGVRSALGAWVGNLIGSIMGTLIFFFVLFLLRVFLRNRTAAVIGFVVFFAGRHLLDTGQTWMMPVWVVIYGIAALAVVRFGLIALAVGVFAANVLLNLPVTLDFSSWYAGTSFGVILSLLVLAGAGAYTSLGGRKGWKVSLFD